MSDKDEKDKPKIRVNNDAYESWGGTDENDFVVAIYENPIKGRMRRAKEAEKAASNNLNIQFNPFIDSKN